MSWFALPTPSAAEAHEAPPAPHVTVPTVAAPLTEPVKLEVPMPAVTIAPPAAVGTGQGTAGGPGEGPGTGGGKGTGTGPGVGADSGSGSGGGFSQIFAKPAYQFLVNTGSLTRRSIPDVSLMMGGCPGMPTSPSRTAPSYRAAPPLSGGCPA